jgi:hypothetical protein
MTSAMRAAGPAAGPALASGVRGQLILVTVLPRIVVYALVAKVGLVDLGSPKTYDHRFAFSLNARPARAGLVEGTVMDGCS